MGKRYEKQDALLRRTQEVLKADPNSRTVADLERSLLIASEAIVEGLWNTRTLA